MEYGNSGCITMPMAESAGIADLGSSTRTLLFSFDVADAFLDGQCSDVNPTYAAERERLNRVNRTTAFTREQTRNADRKKSDDEMRKKYPGWIGLDADWDDVKDQSAKYLAANVRTGDAPYRYPESQKSRASAHVCKDGMSQKIYDQTDFEVMQMYDQVRCL